MKNLFLLPALLLTLTGSASAQQYGAQRLTANGQAYAYPTVVYSQSVVSNTSTAFNNVVNLHWKRGAGSTYVVLAGRYLQRSPYDGTFPTPTPPFSPTPGGPGNGLMDANSRLPGYDPGYEVAPHLLKTGDYSANAADTTAQLLNARPGETYYAYIWEYTLSNGAVQVLSPPPASNLSWQALFTQFHAPPQITSVTLDAQRRPIITWTTATEDTVAGFRIIQANDPNTTSGTLSGAGRTTLLSSVRPKGYATTLSTYSQTLPAPVTSLTYFQVTQFLTNNSTFVTNEPFWSNTEAVRPSPLPVTLVSFTAGRTKADRTVVNLAWATTTELNNRGFRLERSQNGTSWGQLVFVAGAGTRSMLSTYLTVDSCRTAAYYRLAQVDFAGTASYGPVRYVAAATNLSTRLALYPTPATGLVMVLNADPEQPLEVQNVVGQHLHTLPAGTQHFEASGWPRGMYFVRQPGHMAKLILE